MCAPTKLLQEQLVQYSGDTINAASIVSGDQAPLMLENSQETTDYITPSSKGIYPTNDGTSDQSSSSKKLCIEPIDLEKSNPEFGAASCVIAPVGEPTVKDGDEKQKGVDHGGVEINFVIECSKNQVGVKVKVEKKE